MSFKLKILLCSAFFDSSLVSYREYSYSKNLSKLGHNVTLLCGDQGEVWKYKPNGLPVREPALKDEIFVSETGVKLIRKKVILRVSDFLLYFPPISEIKKADVVHVVEFRTGITVVVAMLAAFFGKPVVYDHEQRGDRAAKWYSRLDSCFRRGLIWLGSQAISAVRHTVYQNYVFFKKCSPRCNVPNYLSPIGCSSEVFIYNELARHQIRQDLGVSDTEILYIMSGKLHRQKKVIDVSRAVLESGHKLLLVGDLPADILLELKKLDSPLLLIRPRADAKLLSNYFSAADVAIYTTFTVSQWEAYATGIKMIVPNSRFSKYVFNSDVQVEMFGEPEMFSVEDEQYRKDIDIYDYLVDAIYRIENGPKGKGFERSSQDRFYSDQLTKQLVVQYETAISK